MFRSHHVGFVDGESGPLAIATLVYKAAGDDNKRKLAAKDLVTVARIATHERISANELLYGRAGALHAVLLAKETSSDIISDSVVHSLCDRIIADGHHFGNFKCPLVWEWHGKKYLGAAHGVVGIFYVLLDVPYVRQNPEWMRDILNSIYFIATELQFPDGNFPSRTDHFELNRPAYNKLVQWCHGAPGVIPLFAKTISLLRSVENTNDQNLDPSSTTTTTTTTEQSSSSSNSIQCNLNLVAVNIPKMIEILQNSVDLAEKHIWERGLLYKGVGLCHGISGNSLSILKARRSLLGDIGDKDQQQHHQKQYLRSLYHAIYMTRFAVDVENLSRLIEVPDHPFSLFQGAAGLVWLLADLIDIFDHGDQNENEVFPAMDLLLV